MSIFYLIFIGLCLYFCYRYDGIEEYDSHKQHRLWMMCVYMILLTGFSYGLGGDKFVYMKEFQSYPGSFSEAEDFIWLNFMMKGQMPLWTLTNLTCKVLFDSFYAVQLLESAAINIAVCFLVSKYTHRFFLFLLIYFFSLQYFIFNTEIMREGFAMSFALVGMHFFMTSRRWVFFTLLPFAILFHISATTALLFPFIRFKITPISLLYALLISFSIWVFSDLVLGKVMMGVLGGMGAIVQKVLFYSIQASTIFGFLRSVLTYLVFPFIIAYTSMYYEPSDEIKKYKEKLLSFLILLGILASSFAGFVRLFNYIQIFYLIMLADYFYLLFRIKEHLIIRIGTMIGTIFLITLTYFIHYKSTNTYYYDYFYPYTCILNETDDVFIREIAHFEATNIEESDKNVRNIE